jgi:hypothetical protein
MEEWFGVGGRINQDDQDEWVEQRHAHLVNRQNGGIIRKIDFSGVTTRSRMY